MGHKSSDILDPCYSMFHDIVERAIRTITDPAAEQGTESPAA
jgi:hypothetical protein